MPTYLIQINEGQRKILQHLCANLQPATDFIAENAEEITVLADMFKTSDEDPIVGLQPSPALNGLCL